VKIPDIFLLAVVALFAAAVVVGLLEVPESDTLSP
jgi:hypothetical protein